MKDRLSGLCEKKKKLIKNIVHGNFSSLSLQAPNCSNYEARNWKPNKKVQMSNWENTANEYPPPSPGKQTNTGLQRENLPRT